MGTEFPVYFPPAADIAALTSGAEVASHGPVLGATIAVVEISSNRTFHITSARLEDVRYRLSPAGGSPIGTSSDIEYLHPVFGAVSPIVTLLGLDTDAESAVITVAKDSTTTFEIGFASALSMWESIDADRDGVMFPQDDDEVIELTCALFFEGYLDIGLEFSGAFPPPLLVHITVSHHA